MRIIEPHQLHRKKRKTHAIRIAGIVVVVAIILSGGTYVAANRLLKSEKQQVASAPNSQVKADSTAVATAPRTTPIEFTGNQFRDLYRQVMLSYPNTEAFTTPPSITGDVDADAHIRKLAEARGFVLTRIPVTPLVKLDEPLVSGETDDLLQPLAYQGWQDIKAAAKKDGIPLTIMSAYRSPEFQRNLFMQRLSARGVSQQQIATGDVDEAINANLGLTAVPGYSRHHTGYTVDFWCEDGSGVFANSTCFKWLKTNNYLNAKNAGWIPSYPDGADEQGPEPEPWEYVWVGHDVLFK